MSWKKDTYNIEKHPFEEFIPQDTKYLIIGTFPTYIDNHTFNFFYSGKDNAFWKIIEQVFKYSFKSTHDESAVDERKKLLKEKKLGITDMHQLCYRKNSYSTDENLFPIVLNDIFHILKKNTKIDRLILTSRTNVFGALGLLKTYFLQKGKVLEEPMRRDDKILQGSFQFKGRIVNVLVPYSPSPRLIEKGTTTMYELVSMYKYCLTN